MDFNSLVSNATGSRTIGACLRLCGYNCPADFNNFNLESINDIEKYVRNVCCALRRDRRLQYIDPIFADQPKLFTISPVVKNRLLTFVQTTAGLGEICGMFKPANLDLVFNTDSLPNQLDTKPQTVTITEVSEEVLPTDTLSSTTGDSSSQAVDESIDQLKSPNYVLAGPELHEWVAEMAMSKFVACDLMPGEHFELFKSDELSCSGYFRCKIQSKQPRHTEKIVFSFGKFDKPRIGNIMNHLRSHFQLKSALLLLPPVGLGKATDNHNGAVASSGSSSPRKRQADDNHDSAKKRQKLQD